MKSTISAALAALAAAETISLPQLGADPDKVTVSGHQHGATFACSLQVMFSETIKGAGCIKGAAFAQDRTTLRNAQTAEEIRDERVAIINQLADDGKIDATSNLANAAVSIISSASDTFHIPKNQEASQLIFEDYGVTNLEVIDGDVNGDSKTGIWNRMSTDVLSYIYDALGYISESDFQDHLGVTTDLNTAGTFSEFDQTEFAPGADFTDGVLGGKQTGWVYVPNQCTDGTEQCTVHFVFHRSTADPKFLGERKGYNELGALNNIIMVYPASNFWDMIEEQAGADANNKNGVLPSMIKGMIDRVTSTSGECDTAIQEANDSIDEIEQFLVGSRTDYADFDMSRLDDCPQAAVDAILGRQATIVGSDAFKLFKFDQMFWEL